MRNSKDYDINYWAGREIYEYKSPKPKRSVKRKLAIVISFVLILAITPSMIYTISNLDFESKPKVSVINPQITPAKNTEPEVHEVIIEEPKTTNNKAEVINNDSYWKISKRVCGDGKYYLSIQDQNGGKALYQGDFVQASCSL